uniref:AlNc14C94G5780 protein n=1 Tax=Albugo laibachii Nc14 TaxID=890382 RepID=F0WGQ3_9STRA|nr:AlNc14C94G5780 [Albugo laibachii Nc14]|eukprot:CCA20417.1 AlNc14C94G5780 [Albugo laibachii Nc14]
MPNLEIWTVLIVYGLGAHFNQAFTQLETRYVDTHILDATSSFNKCQQFLMEIGGANSARLLSHAQADSKSGVKKIYFKAKFEVTAYEFRFAIMEQYCQVFTFCGKLSMVHRLPLFASPWLNQQQDARTAWRLSIFGTFSEPKEVIGLCVTSQACIDGNVQIPDDVCHSLLIGQPFDGRSSKEVLDLYFSIRRPPVSVRPLHRIREKFVGGDLDPLCLKIDKANAETIMRSIKCVAKVMNGIVIMLQKNADDGIKKTYYAYYLGPSREDRRCKELIAQQFDAPPIGDEIFGWMSEKEQKEQENVVIKYSSECAWTHYHHCNQRPNKCNQCVTSIGAPATENAKLSLRTSMTFFKSDFEKEKLVTCMNREEDGRLPSCLRIVFIPNFMCDFEFTKSEQDVVLQEQLQGTTSLESFIAGKNEVRIGSADTEPTPSATSASDLASTSNKVSRIRLFGTQIHPVKRLILVRYHKLHAQECVTSLALKYDVLMLSSTQQYVWMLVDNFRSDECKDLRILQEVHYDDHGMQSIPAKSVAEYFVSSEEESMTKEMVIDDQDEGEGVRGSRMYPGDKLSSAERSGDDQDLDHVTDTATVRAAKPSSRKRAPAVSECEDEDDHCYDVNPDTHLCRKTESNRKKRVKLTQFGSTSKEVYHGALGSNHDEDDDYEDQPESTQQETNISEATKAQISFSAQQRPAKNKEVVLPSSSKTGSFEKNTLGAET